MEPELIRISELARRCGVTVRTLEVYQRRGLIEPAMRTSNTYRYFDASLENAILAFGALLSLGASLREVGEVFADSIPLSSAPKPEQARESMLRAREFYRKHVTMIDAEIAHLADLQGHLNDRIAYCDAQLASGKPVVIGRAAPRIRQRRPGRVDYRVATLAQ
jgi:DNA-binding transcriptional MerR regulator